MIAARAIATAAVGLVLAAQALQAQDRSGYRDFKLGAGMASVAALAKVDMSTARTIHQRPAVMRELEWRPPYFRNGATAEADDPVERVVFSFYNDQLSALRVDYDRQRTEGLTDADMIDAISAAYGSPLTSPGPKALAMLPDAEAESGTAIARWGGAGFSVVLYRSLYSSTFRMVVTSPSLDPLARTAGAQAIRLDESEAPQREIVRQQKDAEGARAAREKARLANKAAFRP